MKRSTPMAVSLAALLGLVAFAASAQTAPVAASTPAEPTAQADNHAGVEQTRPIDPNCLQYTGSRIKTVDRKTGKRACTAGPGQVYSRDDLNRTGEIDIADALRRLDTSVY